MQNLPRYLFSLSGRIGRVHYWILVVAGLAIVLVAATIGQLNLNNELIQWLSYAILLSSSLPILSATIRRLHDLNISAGYIMLFMIITGLMQLVSVLGGRLSPIIGTACAALSVMAFVALGVIPGTGKPNRYGP
jgi:uncharacterized membrane protein YhaH (DUF805 family)